MNESQYINLQVKKWRAITVNWDILAQNSLTETKLYCLTDFQAAWLLSMTEYMRWSTRWENCPCTQNDLEALKAEMDFNLMSCIDFQPFQMQYLYDSAQQNLIGDYTDSWDGSLPSSVNPDAPDDFFNGDDSDERNDALCTALTLWAYSYALNWLQKASVILNLAFAASEVVAFMIPVGGQIAVQAISDLVAPLQAQFDALQNLGALDGVICDWRDALDGVAINISNWSSAVAGLSYTSETDQWYIQQLFENDSQLLGNFLSFVNSLGQGFELANIGVSICACVDPIEIIYDFTVDNQGWSAEIRDGSGWNANYNTTQGWYHPSNLSTVNASGFGVNFNIDTIQIIGTPNSQYSVEIFDVGGFPDTEFGGSFTTDGAGLGQLSVDWDVTTGMQPTFYRNGAGGYRQITWAKFSGF